MWDNFPFYFPIYISYIHVHMLHIADLPTPSGFFLVAGNLHDTDVLQVNISNQDTFSDEVIMYLDVLISSMEHQVAGHVDISHVVAV